MTTKITYYDHAAGAAEIKAMFGEPRQLLHNGEGWTREAITLGTHNTTHLGAPYHYSSMVGGKRAEAS
jgi:hypothetical protein